MATDQRVWIAGIFISGMVYRVTFAVLAPLSIDWFNFVQAGISAYKTPGRLFGVYTAPAYLFAIFYQLWLSLPIRHPDLLSIVSLPSPGGVEPFYSLSTEGLAFVLMMKSPSLISDFFTGWLIYRILSKEGVPTSRRYWAVSAWLFNPLTLIMSNFNGVDPIGACLTLAAAYFIGRKRFTLSLSSLIAGGLLRFLPFIAVPFLLVNALRARGSGRNLRILSLAIAFLAVGAFIALVSDNDLGRFLGSYPGILVPEAIDVTGAILPTHATALPTDPLSLTAMLYFLLLAFITNPSRNNPSPFDLVLAPMLAYAAFSWSSPTFILYVVPLALVRIACGKGYRLLTILLSVLGFLWSLIRSTLIVPGVSVFFTPLYNSFLHHVNGFLLQTLPIAEPLFSVQVRGGFSALLVFLMVRMVLSRISVER